MYSQIKEPLWATEFPKDQQNAPHHLCYTATSPGVFHSQDGVFQYFLENTLILKSFL